MTTFHERSAGVIPFHRTGEQGLLYLVLHSATVRNPRAKWEFPKGGVEQGESTRQTAAREFHEETGLVDWTFLDGFERSLSYTYIRRGRKVVKTVTYFLVEVRVPGFRPDPKSTSRTLTASGSTGERSRRSASFSTTRRSARSSPRPTPGCVNESQHCPRCVHPVAWRDERS